MSGEGGDTHCVRGEGGGTHCVRGEGGDTHCVRGEGGDTHCVRGEREEGVHISRRPTCLSASLYDPPLPVPLAVPPLTTDALSLISWLPCATATLSLSLSSAIVVVLLYVSDLPA